MSTAVPLRRSEIAELTAAVRALTVAINALRSDLARKRTAPEAAPLLDAIEGFFSDQGRFTVAGLLSLAESHSDFANAIGALIDLNASPRARSTALGIALANMKEIEIVATARGCAVYRLRSS